MIAREDYRTRDIPLEPGVYLLRDRMKDVIYVGKAKSLRQRLASYFQPSRKQTEDPKLRSLINSIAFFEVFPVHNEHESLILESRLIKQYTPRYNTLLRDDKRFLMIRIDLHAPFPRLQLARVRKEDGCRYFGPFPIASALRDTVDYLTQYFNLRVCTPREPAEEDYRHCNADIIRHCSAPCIGRIDRIRYREKVQAMIAVIEGKIDTIKGDLERRMLGYAGARKYEQAARLRDVLRNLGEVFGERKRDFRRTRIVSYAGDLGVADLQESLNLERPPICIECFDISNIMGQFTVASMACFRNGRPSRKDYRHFRIKSVEGIDDFASMREVVMRRYMRLKDEARILPDLVVIDGGIGQLHAAAEVLQFLELQDLLPIVSLAKREEEIFIADRTESLRLERHRPALRLLQSLRDEAHRFAINYNRDLRRKRIQNSLLDEIPGVGARRKQQLLTKFGSVRTLRKHSADEIVSRVPGIGPKLAADIMRHLNAATQDDDPEKTPQEKEK